jgi:hypothetical protein
VSWRERSTPILVRTAKFIPMHTRVQVSTDVAALGIWDRGQPALTGGEVITLEQLAEQGEACILRMGADCGGAVDVFVDEDVPAEFLAGGLPIAEDRTVVVRSGGIVIDGVEHFEAPKRTSSGISSVGDILNGTYRAKIRVTKNEDDCPEPNSEKEMKRMIGSAEVGYYDKTNQNALLLGFSTLGTLPVLLFFTPWFVAVPVTLSIFLGYFHFQQWRLRRNPRYQRASEKIGPWRLSHERPILAIQLSKWHGELLGGSSLSVEPLPNEEV